MPRIPPTSGGSSPRRPWRLTTTPPTPGRCGIAPAVVGLADLRAMGATTGRALGTATSADAGGPRDRTVGYLAARFDA